jgi:formate dehydrogenase beta subunit/formate dehydrogenase gamma subunit
MSGQDLEVRRSSAALWGGRTGMRSLPVVAKYIDTSTCIGCKACEVACQEWNDLKLVATQQTGGYQTLPSLDANFWNLIKFREQELPDGGLAWLMRKDQCMHCADPGCLRACPAPGAIVQYENGIVDVNADRCIGCGLCQTGCPFDVPRFSQATAKMAKCTLCVDRVQVGLEPACIKACPTGCLQFGAKDDMLALAEQRVAQLRANGQTQAAVYDPPGVGGTSVVTVLAHGDHPEWYALPSDPRVPLAVRAWKAVFRPVGLFAGAAATVGAVAHFLSFGPKVPAGGLDRAAGGQGGAGSAAPVEGAAALARTRENVAIGDEIVRHRLSSRVIHWATALLFFLALASGMPVWTPVFGWMALAFGGLSVCAWLHPWAGLAFVATSLIMFVHWARDMRLEPGDAGWFGARAIAYLKHQDDDRDTGKYNGGQKLFFYAVTLGALGLAASGLVLWFPRGAAQALREASILAHDAIVGLFLVAMVFHIYLGTAAIAGTFRAMTHGTVDKRWARAHHRRWYRQIVGDDDAKR